MLTQRIWHPRYRGYLTVLMFVLVAWFPVYAHSAALHAIIAGDTADPNIGEGVEADIKNVWDLISDIGQNTPWDKKGAVKVLVTRSVLGGIALEETLSHKNLLAALTNLPAGKDDVIFFYYSGHGTGDDSGRTIWPSLYFANQYLPYARIIDALNAKGARLLIVITDACNNFADWTPELQISFMNRTKRSMPNQRNYQELFLNQRGYVLATSSEPREISLAASASPGSLFTNDLLIRLYQELRSPALPKWENIKTTELMYEDQGMVFTQHPQYEIQLATAIAQPVLPGPQPTSTPLPTVTPIPTSTPVRVPSFPRVPEPTPTPFILYPQRLPEPTPTPATPSPRRPEQPPQPLPAVPRWFEPTPTPAGAPLNAAELKLWLNKPCGERYQQREPIQVHFQTKQAGYAIVYNIDPQNNISLLFPNPHNPDNFVRAYTTYKIPGDTSSYRLFGPRGSNTVELLFSTDEFYHRSYQELQRRLKGLMQDLDNVKQRSYIVTSCEFYVQ